MRSPGRGDRGQHRGVGRRAGVGLDVGELRAEQALRAVDREGLDDVDELAAAVVAASGVALGVLVGQDRTLGLEHGARDEVLARDHLEGVALPAELLLECGGDLGVDLGEREIECVGQRALLFITGGGNLDRLDRRPRPRRATVFPFAVASRWCPIRTPVATGSGYQVAGWLARKASSSSAVGAVAGPRRVTAMAAAALARIADVSGLEAGAIDAARRLRRARRRRRCCRPPRRRSPHVLDRASASTIRHPRDPAGRRPRIRGRRAGRRRSPHPRPGRGQRLASLPLHQSIAPDGLDDLAATLAQRTGIEHDGDAAGTVGSQVESASPLGERAKTVPRDVQQVARPRVRCARESVGVEPSFRADGRDEGALAPGSMIATSQPVSPSIGCVQRSRSPRPFSSARTNAPNRPVPCAPA